MPVQNRKYFIAKHNDECEELNRKYGKKDSININGEGTTDYTQMSISDHKYLGPR
jgi:hypothetical protein